MAEEPPGFPARLRAVPLCVALQSSECRAAPSRGCQYSLVPELYRVAHGLNANAGMCTSRHCLRYVNILPAPSGPARQAFPKTAQG